MGASEPAEVRNGCAAEQWARAAALRNANADARCGCNGAVVKEGSYKTAAFSQSGCSYLK